MVTLHSLPKTTNEGKKRLGRGYGSGKGSHTSSRGQKGQKTRETVGPLFEGTKTNKDFFRRTPMLRGKGKMKVVTTTPIIIKLSQLESLKSGSVVDISALVKLGLFAEKDAVRGVKVLFDKAIDKKLDIQVPASASVMKSVKAE